MPRLIKGLKFFTILFFLPLFIFAQSEINGDPAKGYELFNKNCKACHALDSELVGPALGGVVARLEKDQGLGREWFQSWIKNNKALRESGDRYANEVFNKYKQSEMLAFPDLSEGDIDNILSYTTSPEEGKKAYDDAKKAEEAAAAVPVQSGGAGVDSLYLVIGFGAIAVMLIWVLFKVNALSKSLADPALTQAQKELAFNYADLFTKYQKVSFAALGVLGFFAFFGFWSLLLNVGVDKGYKPEQPIYFSHKIHAGEQQIDCQYCHSSAKYSKHSGIPSTNVCMNCHKVINEYNGEYVEEGKSKDFYTAEISKIYESIGWDPDKQLYSGISKPIEWVRIHNMPDFVYFNHQQHIGAGEKAILRAIENKTIPNYDGLNIPEENVQVCYACHGNVSEMNEVAMANTFTMGWCIDCHRSTEVDIDNEYNKANYQVLHDKLKGQMGDNKLTVEEMGGLECGKCHY